MTPDGRRSISPSRRSPRSTARSALSSRSPGDRLRSISSAVRRCSPALPRPLTFGERLLGLLEESARSSTYKPALLLALLDAAAQHADTPQVPVRSLAERVIELYWPQTLEYPTTGAVLIQSQAGGQPTIVRDNRRVSRAARADSPLAARRHPSRAWVGGGVDRVELTLAEWPIPRLQQPYTPFIYSFDWSWAEEGVWSARTYRSRSRSIRLLPGVAAAFIALEPMLRPFTTRSWAHKAAQ